MQLVYVSSANDANITAYAIDSSTHLLRLIGTVATGPGAMPMAIDAKQLTLTAITRQTPCALMTFAIDPLTGTLRPLQRRPLAHNYVQLAALPGGRSFVAASYGEGVISLLDRQASESSADAAHISENAEVWTTMAGRHPHYALPSADGRHIYVSVLGDDCITLYAAAQTDKHLTLQARFALTAGTGPRHMVLSVDERYLYVIGELSGIVSVFARALDTGALTLHQSLSSIPEALGLEAGKPRAPGDLSAQSAAVIWSADIKLSPNGRFLYTSERSTGTISRFIVDGGDGSLRFSGTTAAAIGTRALAFSADGEYLLAVNTSGSHLHLYCIDQCDGGLTLTDRQPCGDGAAWIETLALAVTA